MNSLRHPGFAVLQIARRCVAFALIAAALAVLVTAVPAGAFQVCARACAITDAVCIAGVVACETRIHAYNIYMDQMGAGQQRFQLPAVYRDLLRLRYPQANFVNYRFAFSDRQPANNATTDCAITYFNSQAQVDALRNAAANPVERWHWLLHEVTHVEQCTAAGGRERYANRWWNELMTAAAASGRAIDFNQPPEALAAQIGAHAAALHDAMPMEQAADNKATAVLTALGGCCMSSDRRPIRPLEISAINDRLDAGMKLQRILSVTAVNGDRPLTSVWRIKSPGESNFVTQPQNLVNGLELLWRPKTDKSLAQTVNTATGQTLTWKYDVQVDVSQGNSGLGQRTASKSITLSERVFSTTIDGRKIGEPAVPGVPRIPRELPPPMKPGPPKPPLPPGGGG